MTWPATVVVKPDGRMLATALGTAVATVLATIAPSPGALATADCVAAAAAVAMVDT